MTTDVEFGITVLPGRDALASLELLELADAVGLSFAGVGDSQSLWDDVYVLLGAAAVRTRTLRLGPLVTNAITRHETVTANAVATLHRLSEGRAFLGVGYGDSSVKTIGLHPSRLGELVASVAGIRSLIAGGTAESVEGSTYRLVGPSADVEIWWAADGPRSLEDAGRYADCVIANGLIVPEYMEHMRRHVAIGQHDPRRQDDVDIVFQTGIAIDDDGDAARQTARPYLARTLCHDVATWLPGWSHEQTAAFKERYDYFRHIDQGHAIAELVPDELITHKAVAGSPEECADLLQAVIAAGFTRISLTLLGEPIETVRRLTEEVLPRL